MRLIDADALYESLRQAGMVFALRMVKSAPTIAPTPKDPLTLEELREMDGEPVWIEAKHSECFADVLRNVAKSEGRVYIRLINHWTLQENGYGKTWLAYRRKPEEGTR